MELHNLSIVGIRQASPPARAEQQPMLFYGVVAMAELSGDFGHFLQVAAFSPEMNGGASLRDGQFAGPHMVAGENSEIYPGEGRRVWISVDPSTIHTIRPIEK